MGQQQEITYTSKSCQHNKLARIGMGHYYCENCGIIFNIMLTTQFSYEDALKHYGDIFIHVKDLKSKIRKAEKKEEKRQKELERKAVEDYKTKQENKKNEKQN